MTFVRCKSRTTARKHNPSAAIIVKVEGGFIAFDYIETYLVWRNQK